MSNFQIHDNRPPSMPEIAGKIFGASLVAASATGVWASVDEPIYVVDQTTPSYSAAAEKLLENRAVLSNLDFASKIATAYKTFVEYQEPLGEEFEAAIFTDIESLYEA